ncbi:divalent-cation tolerance protein CutA [Salidesulfovibrio onnuriiensis]|uniref:divalent-cation tolerance protein CutA n=1 Tax=Salidesulfovibrio onnuriiensis TaxID=2583823 RepID=UPI0011CC7503|nr:divalent-cation tolerance protein CutA [Salidesulfovibrio onnuriiensis]
MPESLLYMTFGAMEEAQRIGEALVRGRLAACVNILPGMRSLYWWKGRVETADEVVMIAKTRTELTESVIEYVRTRHSYEVPSIVSMSIAGGNPDFLDWIRKETRETNDSGDMV